MKIRKDIQNLFFEVRQDMWPTKNSGELIVLMLNIS